MSNVHGLFGGKKDDDDNDDENNRFVGGIGERGGGSGLAVQPNPDHAAGGAAAGAPDAIFGLAESASAADAEGGGPRRTITMYRNGFIVDDGPYRRLDDPANSEFLRSLAAGKTPRELIEGGNGDVTVALVDKRSEDYVETFQSFSGVGTSLGGGAAVGAAGAGSSSSSTVSTANLPMAPPTVDESRPVTSIQIRLLNGKRKIIKINLDSSVMDLAAHLREDADGAESFRLVSGFPPKPLEDLNLSVEDAGLKGAQVSMQKA